MNNKPQAHTDELTIVIIYCWSEIWKWVSLTLLALLAVIIFISDADGDELAIEPVAPAQVELSQVKNGSLLFKVANSQRYHEAPTLATDVEIEVTGMIARTSLKQQFTNNQDSWVEGIYVFPLPENAAVDHLRIKIGERIIEGEIKTRQDAKRIYNKARIAGKKAALVEQERPNLFTNSVANIAPGETVVVEIEYQQTLRYDSGAFSLRFPMAITPRYIPGNPIMQEDETIQFGAYGWATNTDQVPDAARITPFVSQEAARTGSVKREETSALPAIKNPVRLSVVLNSGFKLDRIASTYHPVNTKNIEHNKTVVTLAEGQVVAERDFELQWWPAQGTAPKGALFTEEKGGERYHLLMALPPQRTEVSEQINREVIYVIDTSGSMHGTSMEQARAALQLALQRLKPGDRFNVIAFNSSTDQLFSAARVATAQNRRAAQRYVASLKANGGTEIRGALEAALLNQEESAAVRQVIFLTDGSVGNEAALFKFINQSLGNSRLFTIGIGSAPNSHFMSKAAQFGRGTFTYIGDVYEVQSKMAALFQKLETAVMTDVKATFDDPAAEVWPQRLADLYQGEPLILTARTRINNGVNNQSVVLSGQRLNQQWQNSLALQQASNGAGIATLWARNKIAALMDQLRDGEQEAVIKPQVINVALQHHLVSKYTSLVAVDVTPSRPVDETLDSHAVPVNLPKGQVHAKIFGRHAQSATPAQLQLIIGVMLLLMALWVWRRNQMARVDHAA